MIGTTTFSGALSTVEALVPRRWMSAQCGKGWITTAGAQPHRAARWWSAVLAPLSPRAANSRLFRVVRYTARAIAIWPLGRMSRSWMAM